MKSPVYLDAVRGVLSEGSGHGWHICNRLIFIFNWKYASLCK